MTISSIGSIYNTAPLSPVQQVSSGTQSITSGSDSNTSSIGLTDGTKISSQAQFLSQLQQLQTNDPDKFKQVVTDIANKLGQAAQQLGKSGEGKFLADLAAKFQSVADTGDLSPLQPPVPQQNTAVAAYAANAAQSGGLQGLIHGRGHHYGHQHASGAGHGHGIGNLFAQINQEVSQALVTPPTV